MQGVFVEERHGRCAMQPGEKRDTSLRDTRRGKGGRLRGGIRSLPGTVSNDSHGVSESTQRPLLLLNPDLHLVRESSNNNSQEDHNCAWAPFCSLRLQEHLCQRCTYADTPKEAASGRSMLVPQTAMSQGRDWLGCSRAKETRREMKVFAVVDLDEVWLRGAQPNYMRSVFG